MFRFRGTAVAAKQYYVFVANMERVFEVKGLPSFPCDGDEALYQQISAGAYTAGDLARWRAGQAADAAQHASQKRERAQRHQMEDRCVLSGAMPCGPAPVRRPVPKRKVAVDPTTAEAADETDWSASDPAVGSDVGASDADSLAGKGEDSEDGELEDGGAVPLGVPAAGRDAGEASSSVGLPAQEPAEHPAASDPRLQGSVVACVMGHNICREVGRRSDGTVKSIRFVAQCAVPHHADPLRRCRKRRELGRGQTSVYGDGEVLAYLGAWIIRGADKDCRGAHVRFSPTAKDVKRFVDEHGVPDFLSSA